MDFFTALKKKFFNTSPQTGAYINEEYDFKSASSPIDYPKIVEDYAHIALKLENFLTNVFEKEAWFGGFDMNYINAQHGIKVFVSETPENISFLIKSLKT